MRKQLIGTICVAVSVIGLGFWEPLVRAAGENQTVAIVLSGGKPVLRPDKVEISAGQSITWAPEDAGIHHHLFKSNDKFEPDTGDEITDDFNGGPAVETRTKEFNTGVFHYICKIHPRSMRGIITVK
jgi:plastocyanin